MTRLNDITGEVFGRLTAIEQNGRSANGKVLWKCSCLCGNELNVISGALISGNTKSCGCYKKDVQAVCNKTHGMSYSSEYRNWADMRKRCLEKSDDRASYFDRGIGGTCRF